MIEKTRIDGHLLGAGIGIVIGAIPVVIYWFSFSAFGSSTLPWKISFAVEVLCPIFVCVSYFFNKKARRLVWAGVAVCVGFLPTWLLMGSYWVFYFGFAPISFEIRVVALIVCSTVVIGWTWLAWRTYARETRRLGLVGKIFEIKPGYIDYADESDAVIGAVEGPGSSIAIPYWLVSAVAPLLVGYAMFSGRMFDKGSGPHGVFIIFSAFSLPITCWIISKIFVRFAYFHIYLPFRLERETGKKVLFGQ
ncbi:putative membrane protein [Burkholderia cenocepacia]|uniref:Membrane protein n=1 Tax=Burkholderia cenocepacia TaxID=95486 RepID=A0AAN0RT81_9BURK|nr:putative membrane protein [Burkholderia cenocepacia]